MNTNGGISKWTSTPHNRKTAVQVNCVFRFEKPKKQQQKQQPYNTKIDFQNAVRSSSNFCYLFIIVIIIFTIQYSVCLLLTNVTPFLVRYFPRCLALPPKNFPSSLIQVKHSGTPKRP